MDKDIKKAEEKLEYLSSDPVTQELYFERERALHEKANLINTGIKQGIKQEKIEMARKLLQNNFSVQMIVELTELTEEEINEIKSQFNIEDCGIQRLCGCYVDGEKNINDDYLLFASRIKVNEDGTEEIDEIENDEEKKIAFELFSTAFKNLKG